MRLSPLQRKEIAEKLLAWLKGKNITNCESSYKVIRQCSEEIHEQIYDLWKAYELLRIMGRLELNNPNGKRGFHVIDFTPLATYQLRTDGFKRIVQKDMLIKMLINLKKQYAYIWDEVSKELSENA